MTLLFSDCGIFTVSSTISLTVPFFFSFILIFSAPLIGFFLNGLRILSIGADPESQIGESHTLQGILVIICGVLLIAGEEALLRRAGVSSPIDSGPGCAP